MASVSGGRMKIIKMAEISPEPLVNPLFTSGDVTHQSIVTDSPELSVGIVNFGRGVRNKFHSHDGDQVLIVSAGRGIVATENEERKVKTGDVVFFPAGEKHWHGAAAGATFSHIVITRAGVKLTQLED